LLQEPLAKAIALDTDMEENREVHKTKADNAQQQLSNLEEGKNAAIGYLEEENKYNRAWHFILQKNWYYILEIKWACLIFRVSYKAGRKIEKREAKINDKKEEYDKIKAELASYEERSKDLRDNIKQKEEWAYLLIWRLETNYDFYSAIKECKSQTEDIDKKYKENDAEFAKVSADMAAKNNRRKKLGENVNSEKKKVCLMSQTYIFLISQFSTVRGDGWASWEKPEGYKWPWKTSSEARERQNWTWIQAAESHGDTAGKGQWASREAGQSGKGAGRLVQNQRRKGICRKLKSISNSLKFPNP
jgi:hypothetical protein